MPIPALLFTKKVKSRTLEILWKLCDVEAQQHNEN